MVESIGESDKYKARALDKLPVGHIRTVIDPIPTGGMIIGTLAPNFRVWFV